MRASKMITAAGKAFPRDFWPWYSRTSLSIDLGRFDDAKALLAAPPPLASDRESGHVLKLRARASQGALGARSGDGGAGRRDRRSRTTGKRARNERSWTCMLLRSARSVA